VRKFRHKAQTSVEKNGYDYIVMLKSNTKAHADMISEHGADVRWDIRNLVGRGGLFGISARKRLFSNFPLEANATLFFDGRNGSERSVALLDKVLDAVAEAERMLAGGLVPEIPEGLRKYIGIQEAGGRRSVTLSSAELQKAVDSRGYGTIASSLPLAPAEVNRLYHLRDTSEKQYMFMKTQLGGSVTRVHSTEAILGKFAACFAASILRHEILHACQERKLVPNKMLVEMDRIILLLNRNDIYSVVHDESSRQKALLAAFDILPGDLEAIAGEFNGREGNSLHGQIRAKPERKASGRHAGRPKGSGRKGKVAAAGSDKPKKGRGRPKGSLNRKTIERLKNQPEQPEQIKRGKGRPKGSKNKPKTTPPPKRGRGRPKGSRNKPKPLAKQD